MSNFSLRWTPLQRPVGSCPHLLWGGAPSVFDPPEGFLRMCRQGSLPWPLRVDILSLYLNWAQLLHLSLDFLGENKVSILLHLTNTGCLAQRPIWLLPHSHCWSWDSIFFTPPLTTQSLLSSQFIFRVQMKTWKPTGGGACRYSGQDAWTHRCFSLQFSAETCLPSMDVSCLCPCCAWGRQPGAGRTELLLERLFVAEALLPGEHGSEVSEDGSLQLQHNAAQRQLVQVQEQDSEEEGGRPAGTVGMCLGEEPGCSSGAGRAGGALLRSAAPGVRVQVGLQGRERRP